MNIFTSAKEKIYSKVFKGSAQQYSYVQEIAALHMSRLTIKLNECETENFKNASQNVEKFYAFVFQSIDPETWK